MPKFCTSCGAELVENARFCRQCGAVVRQTGQTPPPVEAAGESYAPPPPIREPLAAPPQYMPPAAPPSPNSYLQKLEQWLRLYLVEKAPPLPHEGRQWVAKAAPWVTLVMLVFSLPGLVARVFSLPFGFGYEGRLGALILLLLALALAVLRGLSLPGLFNRTLTGWRMAYYAALVGVASGVLHFSPAGLLVNALILYLLFQARNQYR